MMPYQEEDKVSSHYMYGITKPVPERHPTDREAQCAGKFGWKIGLEPRFILGISAPTLHIDGVDQLV